MGGELGRSLRSAPGQPRIAPREAVSRGLHTREQPPPPVQGLQHLHDQLQGMQAGAARPGGGCASEAPPSMPDLQGQALMEPGFEALQGQLTKGLICLREAALPLECSAWGQRAPWGQGGGGSIHSPLGGWGHSWLVTAERSSGGQRAAPGCQGAGHVRGGGWGLPEGGSSMLGTQPGSDIP